MDDEVIQEGETLPISIRLLDRLEATHLSNSQGT
jgi:hypothetical protein